MDTEVRVYIGWLPEQTVIKRSPHERRRILSLGSNPRKRSTKECLFGVQAVEKHCGMDL